MKTEHRHIFKEDIVSTDDPKAIFCNTIVAHDALGNLNFKLILPSNLIFLVTQHFFYGTTDIHLSVTHSKNLFGCF